MNDLDLHGISHDKAEEKIRSFLNFVPLPCMVTTGNSPRMKKILLEIVKEYGWIMREPIYYNKGSFIIEPKSGE